MFTEQSVRSDRIVYVAEMQLESFDGNLLLHGPKITNYTLGW